MFDKVHFELSAFKLEDLPEKSRPEVVLCGRSNVGKSSFINSLFDKKGLARISSTPGKTRSINYYNVDEKFYLVDFPGFGYAKTSKKEREYWGKLISDFILNSKHIELAIHLIDSRHKPMELDLMLNELLKYAQIPYLVLLNKADKLKQAEFRKTIKNVTNTFPELIQDENLFFYSSTKGIGKKDIMKRFSNLFYLK